MIKVGRVVDDVLLYLSSRTGLLRYVRLQEEGAPPSGDASTKFWSAAYRYMAGKIKFQIWHLCILCRNFIVFILNLVIIKVSYISHHALKYKRYLTKKSIFTQTQIYRQTYNIHHLFDNIIARQPPNFRRRLYQPTRVLRKRRLLVTRFARADS